MEKMNIFEKAVIGKYRFNYKGLITVEDLFDLSLGNLDNVYKNLNAQKKQNDNEESLLLKKSNDDDILDTKIEIVKNIVERKLIENESKVLELQKQQKKKKIETILADKEDEDLKNKTPEQLKAMLADLE